MFDIISEILAATIRHGTPLLMIALGEIYVSLGEHIRFR